MPQQGDWYPTGDQLKDPVALERALRQVLTQHYDLRNRVARMQAEHGQAQEGGGSSGPSNSKLLGLRVEPVDTQTLADAAVLKYSKARGTLYFG